MGNLTEHHLHDNNVNTFAYDAMNRRITEEFFDGRTVTYTYTPTGQRATVTDERGTMTHR